MTGFLEYSQGDSIFHRLNPLSKLVLAVFLSISCFVSNQIFFSLAIIFISLVIAKISGIAEKAFSMLKALAKLGIVLFIIQVLIAQNGSPMIPLPFSLAITDKGAYFSALIVLRLIGATMPLGLLLSVTKMSDLSNVMVKKLHIPYQYAFAFTTAIRFIPIFANEMAGIMEAQTARGVEFDTKNVFKKMHLILPLCLPLLITSVKKIESGAISAELRGIQLRNKKSGYKNYPIKLMDFATIAASLCIFVIGMLY